MPQVSNSGPSNGIRPMDYITGRRYLPTFMSPTGTGNTAANELYYTPIYIWQARSFQGASIYNSGAGDNGERARIGLYTHSAINGPTTRLIDFGEITFTAAAAERVLTSSVTIDAPGWYWLATHFNSATAMYAGDTAGHQITAVGYVQPNYENTTFGAPANPSFAVSPGNSGVSLYVVTAYGAFASTAVAPTANVRPSPLVYLIP